MIREYLGTCHPDQPPPKHSSGPTRPTTAPSQPTLRGRELFAFPAFSVAAFCRNWSIALIVSWTICLRRRFAGWWGFLANKGRQYANEHCLSIN